MEWVKIEMNGGDMMTKHAIIEVKKSNNMLIWNDLITNYKGLNIRRVC